MPAFRSFLAALAIATGLIASPAALQAQFPSDVQVGSRVRIWLPEPHRQQDGPWNRQLLRGYVESVTPDTLRLTVPGAFGAVAVPRASMRRLELSRGEPSRVASAFERAVGGAIGGAILWAVTNDSRNASGPNYQSDWEAAGVGAAWGAGAGALVGIIFPHERWRRLSLGR